LPVLAKGGTKSRRLFPRELNHPQLRDHDRPAENRDEAKQGENNFAGNGRVFERKKKTAGRENLRK
jgi:hypothetical protein